MGASEANSRPKHQVAGKDGLLEKRQHRGTKLSKGSAHALVPVVQRDMAAVV